MKFAPHLIGAFLILMACSGCVPIPYHAVVRPGAEGVIADARTGQPIAGAKITIDSTNYYMSTPTARQLAAVSRETTSDGKFTIPPEQVWRFELTPNFSPNDGRIEGRLLISHPLYETSQLGFCLVNATLFWPLPRMTNLSTVHLNPLPK